METLRVAFIFGSHLLALLLAIYTARTSGVGVEVLLYAFMIDYVFRLGTIKVLHEEMVSRDKSWIGAVAPFISRSPAPAQPSLPVREGEGGPPARLSIYLVVMAALGFFAFVLANVAPDRQIHITAGDFNEDLSWAMLIGMLYWINSLLTRTIVLDPSHSVTHNLGYNTREVTVLALAVLTGAVAVMVRQEMDLPPSGWTVMGPLLGFRFLYELSASLTSSKTPRSLSAPGRG